jgi:hypothetical protein
LRFKTCQCAIFMKGGGAPLARKIGRGMRPRNGVVAARPALGALWRFAVLLSLIDPDR